QRGALPGGRSPVGQLPDERLIEPPPARTEEEQGPGRLRRLHGTEDGARCEHHPRSPAEGRVVHRPPWIDGRRAQIVDPQIQEAGPAGASDEALAPDGLEEAGKDGEEV